MKMELSVQTKSYVVLAIVLGCFVILYPKIFHPMIMSALGYYKQESTVDEMMMHPRERMMRGGGAQHSPPQHHSRPHPGMRMAGVGEGGGRGGGRSGGVMGMILPVYAIGIVLYLLYTLVKVFGGNKSEDKTRPHPRGYMQHQHQHPHPRENFRGERSIFDDMQETGENGRLGGPGGVRAPHDVAGMQQDLEHLLRKVEDRSMSDVEMRELRRRLEDTEAQMTRILEQMQSVQRHVQDNAPAAATAPPAAKSEPKLDVSDSENEEFGDASSELPSPGEHEGVTKRTGYVASDLS